MGYLIWRPYINLSINQNTRSFSVVKRKVSIQYDYYDHNTSATIILTKTEVKIRFIQPVKLKILYKY